MNKLIYIVLVPLIVVGQIFNRKPVAGDSVVIIHTDTTTNNAPLTPGPSGNGVIWDFNYVVFPDSSEALGYSKVTYKEPKADSILQEIFPTAEIVEMFDMFWYGYTLTNDSLINIAAYNSEEYTYFLYKDPQMLLKYPLTPTTSFKDTFVMEIKYSYNIDSTIGYIYGSINFNADGVGTLKVNNQSYDDIIRAKVVRK